MNLEQRLRSELERSGRDTTVVDAPSIDELATVANQRRSRNRVVGVGAGVVLAGGLLFGAVTAAQSSESSLEVAAEESDAAEATAAAETEGGQVAPDEEVDVVADESDAVGETEVEESEAAVTEDNADADAASTASTSQAAPTLDGVDRSLQVDTGEVEVETRSSAVALAASSGVLVASDGDGGYAGLATRFGGSTSTIGLSSSNGLDWTEVELSGIPAGATASQLTEHNGSYVALFEAFDPATGRSTYVGVSEDLASWELSAPLAGEPFATGLAVGDGGVIVLGDNSAPDVWVGPIGGPYERTARLAATAVTGVTTLGDEFLVAGRSADGATLFRSADGVEWTGAALRAPSVPGAVPVVSVDGGAVILSNADGGGNVSLISTDGGETWNQLSADAQSVSVNSSTLGMLGLSTGGAVVAIADDDTFATAEIDVEAPDRLSLIAAGDDEIVLLQATESGANWIVASR